MSTRILRFLTALAVCFLNVTLRAQVPNLISQQGRVAVNGVNFDGTGQFKFALVNADGSVTYWSNDGTSAAGSQPAAAVSLPVTKGLYSVPLGDTSLINMAAVPASVFNNADLRVRVWFNNGTLGFQQLTPDQRLAPNGYLPDGAVASAKLAPGTTPPPVLVSGGIRTAAANTTYLARGATPALFDLPLTANTGDEINISAVGGQDWGARVFDPQAWAPHPGIALSPLFSGLASSADGTVLAVTSFNGHIHVSTDSGATWLERGPVQEWKGIACSADGAKMVAAAKDGLLYIGTNYGTVWTPRATIRSWTAVASSADGMTLVATVYNGLIYVSTDAGVTWSPWVVDIHNWAGVACSADGATMVAVAYDTQIYISHGGGFLPRGGSSLLWTAVASSSDGTKLVAVAYEGQIHTSTDSGLNWTPRESTRVWTSVASSADGTRLVAGVSGGNLYVSTDSGAHGIPREAQRYWGAVASSADGNKLAAASSEVVYTDAAGGFAGAYSAATFSGASGRSATLRYDGSTWIQMNPPPENWRDNNGNVTLTSGNMGIGTATPAYPLSLGSSTAPTKLALWENGPGSAYGLGIGAGQFRLHVDQPSSRFSFLSAPQGSELLTIQGSGNVGIGMITPNYPLSFGNGFANTKVALWDNGTGQAFGLGTGAGQFRLHVDAPSARFSFLDAPAGNELMTVLGTGNVGVGTSNPASKLHVRSGTDTEISVECTVPGARRWSIQSSSLAFTPLAGSFQIIDRTGGVSRLAVMPNGNVGLSRAPGTNRLEVEGDASKTTAGGWLSHSDRRIKAEIQPVKNALETLDKVNPVTFRYTEEYRKAHPDIKDVPYYNVIAQEFREVFPDAVKGSGEKLPDGSEILQVDTYPATITALAAIKELKKENRRLEARTDALQTENETLKQRLDALEKLVPRNPPAPAAAPNLVRRASR